MTNLKLKKDLYKTIHNQKYLVILLFVMIPSLSFAQTESGWGIKGGVNYNTNGDYYNATKNAYKNPTAITGFHMGVFAKTDGNVFLKPELVYSNTESKYGSDSFKLKKIDANVLAGIKILEHLNVFAGPTFQYIADTKFNSITIKDLEKDFTVGLNLGVGVNFNKLGIDLRYERGFTENEASFINTNVLTGINDRVDTRANQLILSLSLVL